MKKRYILLVMLACAIVICIIVSALSDRRPFRDLQPSDVVSATVHLIPPDKTIQIVEIPELVSYLKEIVIYNKDNSYGNYAGQAVTFTLNMSDGTQVNIMVYNPFVVIDGVGYKTKYEPCEKMNSYANGLLHSAADPECWNGVRAQLERLKEFCKKRDNLYEKQNDLEGQKQQIERALEK